MDLKTTRWDVGTGSDAGIATITLSRPERRNSWTGRMHTSCGTSFRPPRTT